jgi:hypothetical protein
MSRWPRCAPRITALLNKDESDFDDDLRFHVERAAAELVAAGWSEEDARAEVLRRFGDVEATRRYSALMNRRYERAMRSRRTTMGLAQDIGFALRQIVRRPAVATVVVLTLGLGIGAVTAMFALIDGILLRPLPYHEPDRLVRSGTRVRAAAGRRPIPIRRTSATGRASSLHSRDSRASPGRQ